MFGAREELFHSPHRIRLKRTSSVLLIIKTEISSKILKILQIPSLFLFYHLYHYILKHNLREKIFYAQLGNGKRTLKTYTAWKKHLEIENWFFDKMLGNVLVNLIFFLTRSSHSITLLSCNSDAQANDNVNSDVKVSTLDSRVSHGP